MTNEKSAGGIIICTKKPYTIALIRDSHNQWTFPKGIIERHENDKEAAIREIEEEIGISNIFYTDDLGIASYRYSRSNMLIAKTVHYYLFTTDDTSELMPQKEEGIHEAQWFPIDKATKILGYRKTNKPILTKAIERFLSYEN